MSTCRRCLGLPNRRGASSNGGISPASVMRDRTELPGKPAGPVTERKQRTLPASIGCHHPGFYPVAAVGLEEDLGSVW